MWHELSCSASLLLVDRLLRVGCGSTRGLGAKCIARPEPSSRTCSTSVAGGMRRLSLLESLRCSTAVAGDLNLGSAASLDGPLPDLSLLQQPEHEASSVRPPLMLQNKLPRWNEGELSVCLPLKLTLTSPFANENDLSHTLTVGGNRARALACYTIAV